MARARPALAGVLCALLVVLAALWVLSGGEPNRRLRRVATTRRLVALTFDDGPDPRWTPKVLALLARTGAHATFFLIGRNAEAHPDLVRQELASGEGIGNHTWDHPDLRRLDRAEVAAELEQGAVAINAVGAPVPRLFRPPKGLSDSTVDQVVAGRGDRTVYWDLAVEHWVNHRRHPARGVDALLARVRPGSIILAHDGGIPDRTRTVEALPRLLDGLGRRGYRVVSLDELLADSG